MLTEEEWRSAIARECRDLEQTISYHEMDVIIEKLKEYGYVK